MVWLKKSEAYDLPFDHIGLELRALPKKVFDDDGG
jgi:hypothetical protein